MRGLALVAFLLLAGCLGQSADHPRVEGLLEFTDAELDSGAGDWLVHARGQVSVPIQADAKDLRLDLAVMPDCSQNAKDWGTVVIGDIAAGSSANVREDVHAPGVNTTSPQLRWELTSGRSFGGGQVLDVGCGALRTG